ncbi:MAG: glycosyltransferase family 4 protein [Dehalococcoidia bacterium]
MSHRIVIGGLPYFGRMLAGLLRGSGWQCEYLQSAKVDPLAWAATARAVAGADLVYLIGGQIARWSRPDWLLRLGRRPVVMHWVGSDISYALNVARAGQTSGQLLQCPVHWSEASWTAQELRPLGVDAAVVPLTSARLPRQPAPLPLDFSVLTYLPDARPEFYGRASVLRLASSMPAVHFLVVGTRGHRYDAPANVEFLGWQHRMDSVYARSSVLLRLPRHDGLSFMVLEALAAGRQVIWNRPLEGVVRVHDEEDAHQQIERLLGAHLRGELQLNQVGLDLVRTRYAPEQVRGDILSRFEAILTAFKRCPTAKRKRNA